MGTQAKDVAPWETAPPPPPETAPWDTSAPPKPEEKQAPLMSFAGVGEAGKQMAPDMAGATGQAVGTAAGPIGQVLGASAGRMVGRAGATLADDYQKGGLSYALRPPTMDGMTQAAKDAGNDVVNGFNQFAGGEMLNDASSYASNALHSLAETKAFKAAGAMLKDFRAQFNRAPDKINELGRTMLENGLVKAGDSVGTIAAKAEQVRRQTGQQIGQVYDKVLDSITDPASNVAPEVGAHIQTLGFHPEAQADEMKAMLAQKFKGIPGSTGALQKANQVIDELAMNGNNITPDHALELKGHVDSMINWSKKSSDLPLDQEALKEVRGYIQGRLNNQVQALDQVLGNSQSGELSRLNRLYGNVSTIANVAKDRALRDASHSAFGLRDTIMAAGGLAAGAGAAHAVGITDPLLVEGISAGTAALAGAGTKLAGKYGLPVMIHGADVAGSALGRMGSFAPAVSTLAAGMNSPAGQGAPGQNFPQAPENNITKVSRMSTTIRPRSKLGK